MLPTALTDDAPHYFVLFAFLIFYRNSASHLFSLHTQLNKTSKGLFFRRVLVLVLV